MAANIVNIPENVHLIRALKEEGPSQRKLVQIDNSNQEHLKALAAKSPDHHSQSSTREPSREELKIQFDERIDQIEKSTGKRIPGPIKRLLRASTRFTKNYDEPTRNFTMANELAEGLEPTLASLAPALRKPAYVGLWALTIGYAALRTINVGILNGGTDLLRDGVHQFFAGITIPTFVVRAANKTQNTIFDKTIGRDGVKQTLTDLVRPAVSLTLGSKAVHFLDGFLDKHLKNHFDNFSHATKDKLDESIGRVGRLLMSVFPKTGG